MYGYYCALCCSDFPATTHQETLRLHLTSHGHKLSYFRRQYFTSYKEITQWPAYGNEALRDFDLEEYFEDEVLKLNAKEFAQEKCRKKSNFGDFWRNILPFHSTKSYGLVLSQRKLIFDNFESLKI